MELEPRFRSSWSQKSQILTGSSVLSLHGGGGEGMLNQEEGCSGGDTGGSSGTRCVLRIQEFSARNRHCLGHVRRKEFGGCLLSARHCIVHREKSSYGRHCGAFQPWRPSSITFLSETRPARNCRTVIQTRFYHLVLTEIITRGSSGQSYWSHAIKICLYCSCFFSSFYFFDSPFYHHFTN